MLGTGSISDPFFIGEEISPKTSFQNTAGKTTTDPRSAGRILTFIVAGQSLVSNAVDTAPDGPGAFYTPANPTKIDQINVWDGGTYRAAEPLLGTSDRRGNMMFQAADKLITAGVTARIILIPIAMGATSITEHQPGTVNFDKLIVAARRASAVGLNVDAVLWQQGEQDAASGMSQATYQAAFSTMLATFRAEHGNIPWFLAKSTTYANSANGPNIRAAIDALVNGTDILAGPDCDIINGLANRYDYVHPNATGAAAMSTLWVEALNDVF